jgi:hypothetical protein
MHAIFKSTFWSDERVADLSAEEKLSIAWLKTNSHLDLCGFCKITKRTFEFESGMPFEALQRACDALPHLVATLPDGTLLLKEFVREQFSKCGVVSPKNKIVVAAVKRTLDLPEALRRAFYEANPELVELYEFHSENRHSKEGDSIPFEALRRGKSNNKSKSEEGDKSQSSEKPSAITPDQIVGAYPRREDTAQCLLTIADHIRKGESPEAMLAGTRAIAAVIGQLPGGHLNAYVIGAPRFFRDRRWQDDPATWMRHGASSTGAPVKVDLGGRSKTTTTQRITR